MTGSPFDENEADRTVIRPMPGGRRAAQAAAQAAVTVPEGAESLEFGGAPLLAAAGPLLQLLAHLRNTAHPPDTADLKGKAEAELRRFEQRARALEVPMAQLRPAHYALCASLDDVVLDTPWGATGAWAQAPLARMFHQEERGGARFFALLDQLRRQPGQALPVLELMYLCLSLGFMGRFRTVVRGQAEIDRIRDALHAVIAAERPPLAPALSPSWEGVAVPLRRRRALVPLWVMACVAAGAVGLGYVLVLDRLGAASDALSARALQLPIAAVPALLRSAPVAPPPPPPPEPGPLDRLRLALAAEIAAGEVSVLGTDATPVLRVPGRMLFAGANATLLSGATPILSRIAAALRGEAGPVRVIGYTDNAPVHSVAYPSNVQLSAARAQAVRRALAKGMEAERLSAEGRGEADPVTANTSAEGRAQNRRVEIVLHRPDA